MYDGVPDMKKHLFHPKFIFFIILRLFVCFPSYYGTFKRKRCFYLFSKYEKNVIFKLKKIQKIVNFEVGQLFFQNSRFFRQSNL